MKMDFLGLRNLTVLQNAVNLIQEGRGVQLDIDRIDFDDKAVLDSIGTGRTEGVFQLESGGMKSFMKELKPQSLEDIIAGISLYRPGPMDFIPAYIRGKNNPDSVTYDCPQLEPILAPTYGCIVYQEQVMQIVRELAGYTLGRSDLVRRAMSKKKGSVMEKERKNFVYGNQEEGVPGCISNGIEERIANKIYDDMIDFAKYAFNKSHAAAYAVVAYQTAYLKYYYPLEYMAALMTSVMGHIGKISEYIFTCRQMGIKVLPPSANDGESNFSVSDGAIRYGLSAIKSVNHAFIQNLCEERRERGKFTSLNDFLTRMADKEINKRVVENLIKAGALDDLGPTRKQCMMVYVGIMDEIVQNKKNTMAGQLTDKMKKNITRVTTDFILEEETGQTRVKDGELAVVGGMIVDKTIKYTRNNQTMAFLTLEDLVGNLEVIIFPKIYEKCSSILNVDEKVFIKGRAVTEEEKNGKLICEKIYSFDDTPKELWLQFATRKEYEQREEQVLDLLRDGFGKNRVIIYISGEKMMKRLPVNCSVDVSSEKVNTLTNIFGEKNVKVVEKSIENLSKRD